MLNETITTFITTGIESTIGCGEPLTSMYIRILALIGLIGILSSILRGLGTGIHTSVFYIGAFIWWIYNKIRGRTV